MKQKIWSMMWVLWACSGYAGLFSVPESLKPNVAFWTNIYSSYDSHQVVFFDEGDPSIIYAVLDLPKVPGEISSPKYRPQVKKRYQEIEKILQAFGTVPSTATMTTDSSKLDQNSEDYKYIHKLLSSRHLIGKQDWAKRLRCQNGLKSQFALGLKMSGRYADEMKAILKSQALPSELLAIVFVESLFFLDAVSHADASGPWGFLSETGGRFGLKFNRFVKESRDPALATLAAALYLKKSIKELGEWPLAITSYNYGLAGMIRACTNLSTKDIAKIINEWDSPIFKFASKNYYSEFLAALHVYSNAQLFFPHVKPDAPWRYELVQIQKPVFAPDLVKVAAVTRQELADLNPSLTKETLDGKEVIPADFTLRVLPGKGKQFSMKLKKIAPARLKAAENKISLKYRANGREKLLTIARKHGVRPEFLAQKLKKMLDYRPTGTVIIRSEGYGFSQLQDIQRHIVAGAQLTEIAQEEVRPKPAEGGPEGIKP